MPRRKKFFIYTVGKHVPKNVTRVRIHHSVEIIPEEAFAECSALVEVKLHEGLDVIEQKAFYRCSSLLRMVIPASVAVIDDEAFQECSSLVEVELHEGLLTIGERAFCGCSSLLNIIIPSSVDYIAYKAFARCDLLRNVTIPSTSSAITQEKFAISFHTLHDKDISLDVIKGRFDELSLHKLCNNFDPTRGTQAVVEARCEAFIQAVNQHSLQEFQEQDCLGMTPLHILLCSGRDYDKYVIQCMVEKYPDAMLIQDIWNHNHLPLEYALLRMASVAVEVLDFLFETHSTRWGALPFEFDDLIQFLAKMGKPAQFLRNVIRVQRTHFPNLDVDWQHIVTESRVDRAPIGSFLVLVEASASVRRYNCMSDKHRIEVDSRIREISRDIYNLNRRRNNRTRGQ
jgi:hypothetical protein